MTKPKPRVERDDEDLVRLYLNDIGQFTLLSKDDEVRLAQQIETGNAARASSSTAGDELTPRPKRELRRAARHGDDAQQTFVQSNLRLVVSIAKKYQASGLPLLDLIQEGNLGLMHAVEKFDWRKGFKFSTYATWWIRQAITRGIANTGRTIRLPVHAGDTLARLQKARCAPRARSSAGRRRSPNSRPRSRCPRTRSPRRCASRPSRCRSSEPLGATTATPSSAISSRTTRPSRRSRSPRCSRSCRRRSPRCSRSLDERERRDPRVALRSRPRRAPHPRRGRRALQPHA